MTYMNTRDRNTLASELLDIARDRQRKRSRRDKAKAAAGKVFGWLVLAAGLWLLRGLALMLAVGIIHAEWIRQLPTLGYWWAVLIAGLLRAVVVVAASSSTKDKRLKGDT